MTEEYGHNFVLLSPPVPAAESREVICRHQFAMRSRGGFDFYVSFHGRVHSIDAICVTIPTEIDPIERNRLVVKCTNHALTILRLSYDPMASVIPGGSGAISFYRQSSAKVPDLGVQLGIDINPDYRANFINIENVYRAGMPEERANILALLAESQHLQIPAHYRILSVMRALELRLSDKALGDWLSRYEAEFRVLNLSDRNFKNALPELRNWCAHGVGSRRSRGSLVGSVFAEIHLVDDLLQLLRRVLLDHIGDEYEGLQFVVGAPESTPS